MVLGNKENRRVRLVDGACLLAEYQVMREREASQTCHTPRVGTVVGQNTSASKISLLKM